MPKHKGPIISTSFGEYTVDQLIKEFRQPLKKKPQLQFKRRRLPPACPVCKERHLNLVWDHPEYRDPFYQCSSCNQTFRKNKSRLDMQYAWRDGILMPPEVNDARHL